MKTESRQRTAEEYLGQIGARIDRLIDRVKASEATDKLRADIANELRRIDEEVDVARERIGEDLADSKDAVATALHEELDVWKGRLEKLRVQASLGRMEIRDRTSTIVERLDESIRTIRQDIEALDEQVELTPDVTASISKEMKDLRREIEAAEEFS